MSSASLRQWHAYLGLFIAPSVLFFATTGAVQIFNLHEAHGHYRPAVLLEKLSAVHKDQVFEEPHDHPAPDDPAAAQPAPDHPAHDDAPASLPHAAAAGPADAHPDDDRLSASTLALKWFFLAVAVCLIVSTLIGIWMGTTRIRAKAVAWVLLIAGILIPLGLLAI